MQHLEHKNYLSKMTMQVCEFNFACVWFLTSGHTYVMSFKQILTETILRFTYKILQQHLIRNVGAKSAYLREETRNDRKEQYCWVCQELVRAQAKEQIKCLLYYKRNRRLPKELDATGTELT
jgi:hypothetical protein